MSRTDLYCEPASSFDCTSICAAKAQCRAFVMPGKFATAFSPFMNDLAVRMNESGWEVMEVTELTSGARCLPDIIAIYILGPLEYDAMLKWASLAGIQNSTTWIMLFEDVNAAQQRYVLRKSGAWFDGLLARYPTSTVSLLSHYQVKPKRAVFSFPHAASADFFRPLAFGSKDSPVLLSGEVAPDYPLREAGEALLPTGVVRRRTVTTRTASFSNPRQQALDYSRAISRFHLAIAGCRYHRYHYAMFLWPVAKHFEIMAAGTAMVTDVNAAPFLRLYGLLPGRHYIESSPGSLNKTLRHWLAPEQRAALERVTASGQRVVRRFHTGEARARYLNQIASALWASKPGQDFSQRCPACFNRLSNSAPGAACTTSTTESHVDSR